MTDNPKPPADLIPVPFADLRYAVEIALTLKARLSPRDKRDLRIERISHAVATHFAELGFRVFASPRDIQGRPVAHPKPPVDPWEL